MLSVKLSSHVRSVTTLDVDIHVDFSYGVIGLTGPSGCGKTTLLRTIAGLENGFDGKVTLNDSVLFDCVNGKGVQVSAECRGIGMVFQQPTLFTHLNVLGNLHFAQKRAYQKGFTIKQIIAWCGLESLLEHRIEQLSGGQCQRVALARALMHHPKLLLLDEPFTGIDMHSRQVLIAALKKVSEHGSIAMLMVSHDVNDMRLLCGELMLMEQGKIVRFGHTLTLLNQYQTGQLLEQSITATINCEVTAVEYYDEGPCDVSLAFENHIIELCEASPVISNTPVMAVLSADEVSVSLSRHLDSSIVNCLSCELKQLQLMSCGHQLLHLAIGQQVIFAKVTQKSVRRLELKKGMEIYAQFKATAVKLLV